MPLRIRSLASNSPAIPDHHPDARPHRLDPDQCFDRRSGRGRCALGHADQPDRPGGGWRQGAATPSPGKVRSSGFFAAFPWKTVLGGQPRRRSGSVAARVAVPAAAGELAGVGASASPCYEGSARGGNLLPVGTNCRAFIAAWPVVAASRIGRVRAEPMVLGLALLEELTANSQTG